MKTAARRIMLLHLPVAATLVAGALVGSGLTPLAGTAMANTSQVSGPSGSAATAATPSEPVGLPAEIEPLAGYLGQVACDPTAKPGAVALGNLLTATYPGTSYDISRPCGPGQSEHYEGRAVDWTDSVRDPAQAAQASALLSWLFASDEAGNPDANLRRLGIMYLIWNNQIWGAYATGAGWQPYLDCASHPDPSWDTTCHRDHLHVSLSWAGAMGRTSFWTKQVAAADYGPCRPADLNWAAPYVSMNLTPCPRYPRVSVPPGASAILAGLTSYSGVALRNGATGPAVVAVQRALNVPANGRYSRQTGLAVNDFERAHGLPATGMVYANAWRALLQVFGPLPVELSG